VGEAQANSSPAPEISVVIPAFQASATIAACVHALANQTLSKERYEVIVVDDGSTDDTAARARVAQTKVIELRRNMGAAVARNVGVAAARGQTIVFTDADCVATPEFIAALVGPLRDPEVGGSKGVYLTRQRAPLARFVQLDYESRYRHTAGHGNVDFVDTYACCFRRADILRVGGFDPRLRVCEDQDLSFRLAEAGVRVQFAPQARTYHLHCAGVWPYVRKKFRIARWKARVLRRHPHKMVRDSHTPPELKLEIIAACLTCMAVVRRERAWLGAALGVYAALVAPFVVHAARRDPVVAAAAPVLLFGRDLALGAGLLVGLVDLCVSS
jgi:glycosyltransferase involved in cell wall biosynthesis